MYVRITKTGACHPNRHLMRVDNQDVLVDLDDVPGTLVDPSISEVQWGARWRNKPRGNAEKQEFGTITRKDGSAQNFSDRSLLEPYLAAFRKAVAATEE